MLLLTYYIFDNAILVKIPILQASVTPKIDLINSQRKLENKSERKGEKREAKTEREINGQGISKNRSESGKTIVGRD